MSQAQLCAKKKQNNKINKNKTQNHSNLLFLIRRSFFFFFLSIFRCCADKLTQTISTNGTLCVRAQIQRMWHHWFMNYFKPLIARICVRLRTTTTTEQRDKKNKCIKQNHINAKGIQRKRKWKKQPTQKVTKQN